MKLVALFSRGRRGALALATLAVMFAPMSHADAPAGRYTTASGVVTDHETGLEWQQVDDGNLYTFAAAKPHCAGLGGTWRAPSMKELMTIADESRATPAIDTTVFAGVPSSVSGLPTCYQTSTQLAGTGLGWLVCFDEGRPTYDSASNAYRVRCVR